MSQIRKVRNDRVQDNLSVPETLFCPNCKEHYRHKDVYLVEEHELEPLCPVCQDKKDHGEL